MESAKIRIYTYKGKTSNKYYKITYYKGQYNFVHIDKAKIALCKQGERQDGRKYLEYEGVFSFDRKKKEVRI